jgi:hypothetical protein
MPLHSWQLPREEPRCSLNELERAHDFRAKMRWRREIAVGDEGE